jgi:SAM-dependent methyltransferase
MMSSFETRWRDHYEWRARAYAGEAEASAYSARGLAARMEMLSRLLQRLSLPPEPQTLDVGCATGAYVRALTRVGHHVTGLDYSLAHLGRARAADGDGAYVAGEAYALPFDDGTFDLVTCMGVLQVLARPDLLIAEAERVLRPDGALVLEAMNGASLAVRALRLGDPLRGRALSHALHRPETVRRHLVEARFEHVQTHGLYVSGFGAALERWPSVGHRLATAVFFVARKTRVAQAA